MSMSLRPFDAGRRHITVRMAGQGASRQSKYFLCARRLLQPVTLACRCATKFAEPRLAFALCDGASHPADLHHTAIQPLYAHSRTVGVSSFNSTSSMLSYPAYQGPYPFDWVTSETPSYLSFSTGSPIHSTVAGWPLPQFLCSRPPAHPLQARFLRVALHQT